MEDNGIMTIRLLSAGALWLGLAAAQTVAPPVMPIVTPNYAQLKAYLNLTDAQMQSLTDILNSRNTAQQAIYKQISDKQNQLNTLLKNGTTDALTVGQLEIDINNLRKQLPLPSGNYRDSALGVLTADQKAKLPALVNALLLQQPAYQAVTLNLIDGPAPVALPVAKVLSVETVPGQ